MTRLITLDPHDPMPGGKAVVVLRRFDEDDPQQAAIQIILTGQTDEATHPRRPDGTPMGMEEAVEAARKVAESEGLDHVFVLDRLKGPRESDILRNEGDHTVHMEGLADTDEEDGVAGSDMRDVAHR